MPSSNDHLPEPGDGLDPSPGRDSSETEAPDFPAEADGETDHSVTGDTDPEQKQSDSATASPAYQAHLDRARAFLRRIVTIRDEPSTLGRVLLGLGCILLVLLIWHILTRGEGADRIVDAYALPSIRETIESFPALWFERALMRGAMASLGRVLGGFLLAASVAVPLGVVAGCYFRFQAFVRPLSIFGRNVPIAALIPLSLIWFGIEDLQKVLFIFLASIAFIFFDTTQSVRAVAGNYLDTAYTLGARVVWKRGLRAAAIVGLVYAALALLGTWLMDSGPPIAERLPEGAAPAGSGVVRFFADHWLRAVGPFVVGTLLWLPILSHQAIGKVLFPLALPSIVNSLRLLFGLAFGYIMLAEVINAKQGLGYIINMSQRQGPREHIYLCLVIIAVLAFLIDRLILTIQRHAFPYVEDAGS
jgi:NitT/TauT family transport system permease protein